MNRDTLFDWIGRQGLLAADLAVAFRLVRRFRRDFGAWPALAPPRLYVEWLLHRMIFDRDPRLAVIVDKVAMRAHARRVLGHDPTVPLLQVHPNAGALDWARLAGRTDRPSRRRAHHELPRHCRRGAGRPPRCRGAARCAAALPARCARTLHRAGHAGRLDLAPRPGVTTTPVATPLAICPASLRRGPCPGSCPSGRGKQAR